MILGCILSKCIINIIFHSSSWNLCENVLFPKWFVIFLSPHWTQNTGLNLDKIQFSILQWLIVCDSQINYYIVGKREN